MVITRSTFKFKNIHESITTRGLFHPIIVWSPDEKILNVYIGRERVWIAKKEGYTHISAYHPTTITDRDKAYRYTLYKGINIVEKYKTRKAICEQCEFFENFVKEPGVVDPTFKKRLLPRCKKCKCFMDVKWGLPGVRCPIGKW